MECVLQQSMPDEFLIIQGSVFRGLTGLELDFSLERNRTFREALESSSAGYERKLLPSLPGSGASLLHAALYVEN